MYTEISDTCAEKLAKNGRTFLAKLEFTAGTVESGIKKITVKQQSNSGTQTIELGGTVSAQFDVEMEKPDITITGKEFDFSTGVVLDDGTAEYIPVGVFMAQKPSETYDGIIKFTAYDRMYYALKYGYYTEITSYPADGKKILREIADMAGVELANLDDLPDGIMVGMREETSDSGTETVAPFSGYTYREAVGYLAQMYGCFATFDRDGKLAFRWYTETNYQVPISRMGTDAECAEEEYELGTIDCTVGSDTLTAGDGTSGIAISNPVMTQEILDQVWESIGGMTYIPTTASFMGDPCIDLGDIITIEKMDGFTISVPLMGITLIFDGGLWTEVGSYGDTEETESAGSGGSVSAALSRMSTELLLAQEVIASKVSVSYLEANYITSEEIEAAFATFKEAYITSLEVETLLADYIKATELEAEVATFGYVKATELEAEIAEFGYVKTADLDATVASIVNLTTSELYSAIANIGYLKADELDAEVANLVQLNTSYLYAAIADLGYLTADSITVTNITADVANIKSLLAGNAGVGDLQVINLSSANVVIADATIMDAMIASVTADKITSGTIYTSLVTIQTAEDDASLYISGSTLQINDGTYVRVQIGEDGNGDYNLYLWDASGNLLWDALGLTEAGVSGNGGIIKDIAVAEDAAIKGTKLDIESVSSCLNDSGLIQVDASKVVIDDTTLSVAYTTITNDLASLEENSMAVITTYYALGDSDTEPPSDPSTGYTSDDIAGAIVDESDVGTVYWTTERLTADTDDVYLWVVYRVEYADGSVKWTTPTCITDGYLRDTTSTLQTEFTVINGQITSKVWLTDITEATDALGETITEIRDQYTQVLQDYDGITTIIADLTTTVNEQSSKITTIEETAEGIQTTISEISTAVDTNSENIATNSEKITTISETVDGVTTTVSDLQFTVEGNTKDISELTVEIGKIESRVSSTETDLNELNNSAQTGSYYEYYVSTSPTELSGGSWSTTTPTWEDGYYIWRRTTVTTGVGEYAVTTTTDPICLTGNTGATGESGTDGKTTYMHIKYSETATPTSSSDLLDEPNKYIGTYCDYTETDSTDPSDYTWSKFIGDDGADGQDGENGEDGTSSYLHVAYATSEDGSEGFSTTDSTDKTYFGQYVDSNETGSESYTDYTWSKIKGEDGADGVGITSTTAYYAVSESSTYYPTDGGETVAIIDTAIVGTAIVGNSGEWTTSQPEVGEYEYLWMKILIEYTDGTSEYTEPCLLTDVTTKTAMYTLTEKYSDISQTIDDITLTVSDLQTSYYSGYEEVKQDISAIKLTANSITSTVQSISDTVDGHTEEISTISQKVDSISLSVTGSLGGTASIVLTVGDDTYNESLSLSGVRDAFADESSSITISAGTVTFNSGTLIVDSDNFSLDADGNATFGGTLNAPSGTIGGLTIGTSGMYYGTTSMTSTTAGVYIGTGGIRQYSSSSAYVNIASGILTAYGAVINGSLTTSNLKATGGTIGGFTIGSSAIYNGTTSLTSTTEGIYLGTSGIRTVNSSGYYTNIADGALNGYAYDEPNNVKYTWELNTDTIGLNFYNSSLTLIASYAPKECYVNGTVDCKGLSCTTLDVTSSAILQSTLEVYSAVTVGSRIELTAGNVYFAEGYGIRYGSSDDYTTMFYMNSSDNLYIGDTGVCNNIYLRTSGSIYQNSTRSGGVNVAIPAIRHGSITITPSAANTPTSSTVTFGNEMGGTPEVLLTLSGNTPGTVILGATVSGRSSTGFTAWITRTNTSDTTVMYAAIY